MTGRFVIAATMAVAATPGCQGGSDVDDGPDLSGRWAMFAFEDPVAVELQQTGDVLAGRGCCSGLGPDPGLNCCGPVTGEITARLASFGFSFDLGGPYVYATEASVSADGQRMTGTFSRTTTRPIAWVRLGPGENFLPEPAPALVEALYPRGGGYMLTVSDSGGVDFAFRAMYRLNVHYRSVSGDLGSFWSGEMTWNAGEQTLVVGPVPETDSSRPVEMRLHFDGNTLTSVDAMMGSGVKYIFEAVASQQ